MYTAVYRAHGRIYGLCTRPCTYVNVRVHGRERAHVPCTRARLRLRPMTAALLRPVYTAVHRPCTRPFTGRVHGPFMTRTRPCTLYPGCLRSVYAAVHGGYEPGTRPYMIRVPCTRSSLRPVYTAVYCLERTGYTAWYGPCTLQTCVFTFTAHEHGTFYGACTRPCTDLVNGHARAVYTAVNSRVHGQRPCSRSVHGCVHGPLTRPCTECTAVHGRVRVMDGPCTWPVHDRVHNLYTALVMYLYMGGPVHGP